MKNKRLFGGIIIILLFIAAFGLTQSAVAAGGKGGKGGGGNPPPLSQAEIDGLVYMVEEEKLARDVYNAMYAMWGANPFYNIPNSEQNHINAVKNLLVYYEIPDPSSNQPGVFTNSFLQTLYDQLILMDSQSLGNAYKAGGAIEEIDIIDLRAYLAQTDEANIQQVYNNLLNGSYNHLRAFVNALYNQTGEVYVPQYLSPEEYQAIIDDPNGGGGGHGGGGGGHGGPP